MSSQSLFKRALSADAQPAAPAKAPQVAGGRVMTAWGANPNVITEQAPSSPTSEAALLQVGEKLKDTMTKNKIFVNSLAEERVKLSRVSKNVESAVGHHAVLGEENRALHGIVEQLAADISATDALTEQMTAQLISIQQQSAEESKNRDVWVTADADKLDQQLVSEIISKDEELRSIQAQIVEMQRLAAQLSSPSLVGLASQNTINMSSSAVTSTQGRGALMSPGASPVSSGVVSHQLRRSMLMDL